MLDRQLMERPIVPIILYDPHNPPFNNSLVSNICPELSELGGFIVATIANEAGSKVHLNKARMLCYNLLVYNNFNNPDIVEVATYVCKSVLLCIRKGLYRYNNDAVISETTKILTMFSSALVFRYDELKSECQPQVLNAAYQNAENFNSFKQEIESMNQFVNNQGYPVMNNQGYPVQPVMVHQQPMMAYNGNGVMHPMQPNQAMMHQGGYQTGYSGMSSNNMGYPPPPPPPVHSMAIERTRMSDSTMQRYSNPNQNRNSRFSEGTAEIRQSRFHEQPVEKEQPAKEVIKYVEKDLISFLDIEGGSEVDREKHRITVMDQIVTVNIKDKFTKLSASVESFVKEDGKFITKLEDELCDASLENFINQVRVNKIIKDRAGTSNIFYGEGYLVTPLMILAGSDNFTRPDAKRIFEDMVTDLSLSSNFKDLAERIKKIASSINVEENQEKREAVYNFVTSLNDKLTKTVNDFLKFDLRIKTRIDEFVGDIKDVDRVLGDKYGKKYYQAYKDFEDSSMVIMFMDNEAVDDAVYRTVGAEQEDVTIKSLVNLIGVTVVNMTSTELGYKFGDGVNVINSTRTPVLHMLAKKMWAEKDRPFISSYIVTTDNVVYKVHKDYLNNDEFALSLN